MTEIVNYVWMRKDALTPHTIPTHLFYNFQQNAARYPDAQFRVWVEHSSACAGYKMSANSTVRLLGSIPAFSATPVLASQDENHLWAKVDIARLLVLERSLRRSDCATAFYADFDIQDVSLHEGEVRNRLKKYGAAFGASFHPDSGNTMTEFENGYLAFTRATASSLDFIIKHISEKAANLEAAKNRNYIFRSMRDAVTEWAKDDWVSDQLGWSSALGLDLSGREAIPIAWQDLVGGFPIQYVTGWRGNTHRVAEAAHAAPARRPDNDAFVRALVSGSLESCVA